MPYQFNLLCQESTLYDAWSIVRKKGASGGIDGVSADIFNVERLSQIRQLREDLQTGNWHPQPYWQIRIPKKKDTKEYRNLGMAVIRDKIAQQAIRRIIEPRMERLFLSCSYAYRPGKGALKAIKYVLRQSIDKRYPCAMRLDVDNFFDEIDHEILQQRLTAIGVEDELIRLIMLSVKMGKVEKKSGRWQDVTKGVPQGAVLSPILANLYLHSFDQFATSKGLPYLRYGDDALFFCESMNLATELQQRAQDHLNQKLKLSLNPPAIYQTATGVDFLGVTIRDGKAFISDAKREELKSHIIHFTLGENGLSSRNEKEWHGMKSYYGKLLPQSDLEDFDATLMQCLSVFVGETDMFNSKTALRNSLENVTFLSIRYRENKVKQIEELVGTFLNSKHQDKQESDKQTNQKIIQKRKLEYRKLEAENSGLLVNKPGAFIGLTTRGVTVSHKGKVLSYHHKENLSQILITGKGVSLSSNLVEYCLDNKVPIDFFNAKGTHIGTVLSAKSIQNSLWQKQSEASPTLRNTISLSIIQGKIKNQHSLIKYFHKYHKKHYPKLQAKMDAMDDAVQAFADWKKQTKLSIENFLQKLVGHEAQVAITYWDYLRELLSDDQVEFESRQHHGATDLVNSMLNYGYAILYVRVWQALLAARLNPFMSLIHVRQEGKPTLVYDMVEIFRSQVVDRVVISLIQKGQDLSVSEGLLTENTRQLLTKSVMERLARYEKYQGVEMRMEQIIQQQAKLLAKAFDSEEKFKPYVAKW